MKKSKRIISIMLVILSVGATLCYAATNNIELKATQEKYVDSYHSVSKNTKDNSAIVNLTAGPDRVNAPLYCFVAEYIDPINAEDSGKASDVYRTSTSTIYSCGSTKLYYNNPFDYNIYMNKKFRAFFRVVPRSRYYTTNVAGTLTP